MIWTIGHSTRTAAELVGILGAHGIELVADVRRFPASRRLPQFNGESLGAALASFDISYCWIERLGGRRRPRSDSTTNRGWRVDAFRGYADYIGTEEFADGLFELLMQAGGLRTAIMCAEVLWWRCHRRIISDVLVFLGGEVTHILDAAESEPHHLRPPASVINGALGYPARRTVRQLP